MRVLVLADILPNGGAERQLALLASHLPEEYELRVWSMDGGPFVEYLRDHGTRVAISGRRGRFDLSLLPGLWGALTSWRPDVVHSWGWMSTVAAGPMCRRLKIPLIDGSIRTATPPTQFVALKRFGMAAASLVVTNSRAGLEAWRVPAAKGRVIYNGFDTSRLRVAEKAGKEPEGFGVVMVGRMEPEKDYRVVIEAARMLGSQGDGWRFSLVGAGSDKARLEAAAADLVRRGVVEFVDGGIEALGVISQADAGVLMTDPRLAREGCSNALMEYMACGLPVVCGDGGGNSELVIDGVTGFVIPQGHPEALADRLRDLRSDPRLRIAMGESGRARVLSDFSVAKMVDEYRDAYAQVLRDSDTHVQTSHVQRTVGSAAAPGGGLRVLMLAPYPNVQGPLPTIVSTVAAQLTAMGCEVETDLWSRHADEESAGAKIVGRIGDLVRILAHARRGRFDVLFVPTAHNWAGLARDLPLVLASKAVCPHRIVHFHGSYADRLGGRGRLVFKALSRLLVRSCDAVLLLSQDERVAWTEFEPGARYEVVLNPFVASSGPTVSRRDAAGSAAKPPPGGGAVVLFVGRLMPEKGIFDLVEATRLIVDEGDSVSLIVAGAGPAAVDLRERIDSCSLGGQVDLRGCLVGEELQRTYDEADIFALPTYWAEGFPTVILEAMNAGLPIVTTPIRGAVDQLEEGVNALFVPPQRPDLLAEALRRLMDDEGLRARMGDANRLRIADFRPEAVVIRYVEILSEVARSEPAAVCEEVR